MLELRDISTGYDGVPVNRRVSFVVKQGQVVSLVGRNGVGKTTLAKAVIGLKRVEAGQIKLEEQDLTGLDARQRARAGVGYVPQGRGIFPDLTVVENLQMGRRIGSKGGSLDRAYDLFPVLKQRRNQLGGTLSGGQQQMLAIGRVLIGEPKVLVLDEPSDGIQPSIVEMLGELIRGLNERTTMAILLIEQNVDLITACADRCLVMEKGTIVDEMEPRALEDPEVARRTLAV